jgi:hypothetical protein
LQVATNQVNQQVLSHVCVIDVVSRWKQMQVAANHQEQHEVVHLHLTPAHANASNISVKLN